MNIHIVGVRIGAVLWSGW